MPEVGERAPDFSATASDGSAVSLAALRGKKNVVLYFYPRDFTAVCTRETCGFRDLLEQLGGDETEVIGVSSDSDAKHEDFRAEHRVGFPLLADADKRIAKLYGASGGLFGVLGMTSRITYVIGKDGTIAAKLAGAFSAAKHVEGARDALAKLA